MAWSLSKEEIKSAVGGLYNEVPDRIAAPLILVCAGYVGGSQLEWHQLPVGWIAAIFSVFTAYIRELGGSLGVTQSFMGPMAKQHCMALLTMTSLVIALTAWSKDPAEGWLRSIMTYALLIIIIGCILTSIRRLWEIAFKLHYPSS